MGSSIRALMDRGAQPPSDTTSLEYKPTIGEAMQRGPSIGEIMGGQGPKFDPYALAPREVTPAPEPGSPGFLAFIGNMLKQQGLDLVQLGKYALTSPGFGGALPVPGRSVLADAQAAAQGDPDAQERLRRGTRGAAFAGSTVVAGGLGGLFGGVARAAGNGLLARATAFIGAEALGGATYGAITPLEEDVTRGQEMAHDALSFAVAGSVLHGVFKGAGYIFKGLRGVKPEVADALRNMSEAEVRDVGKSVKVVLDDLGDIPPGREAEIHAEALNQAVEERLRLTGERRPTTVTARVVDQPQGPAEADFTVEGNLPPEPPPAAPAVVTPRPEGPVPGLRADLGTVSEAELAQEAAAIAPRPAPVLDEETLARARVEAARTTPFPEIPGVPSPGTAVPTEPPPVVPPPGAREAPVAGSIRDVYSKGPGTFLATRETDEPLQNIGQRGLKLIRDELQAAYEGVPRVGKKSLVDSKASKEAIAADLATVQKFLGPEPEAPTPAPVVEKLPAQRRDWKKTPEGHVKENWLIAKVPKEAGLKKEQWRTYENGKVGGSYPTLKAAKADVDKLFAAKPADIPPGISDQVEQTLSEAILNPGEVADLAIKDVVADQAVRETHPTELMDATTLAETHAPPPNPITDPIELRLATLKEMVAKGIKLPERVPLPEVEDVDKSFAFSEFTRKILEGQKVRRDITDAFIIPKINNEMIEAWWSGDATQIANTYLDAAKGNPTKASKWLVEHGNYFSKASIGGVETANGIKHPADTYALKYRSIGAIHALAGEDLASNATYNAYKEPIVRTNMEQGFHDAYYDTMGSSFKDQRSPILNHGAPDFDPANPELQEGHGGLSDEDLRKFQKGMESFWKNQQGAISFNLAVRMAGVGLSGISFYSAEQSDDPQTKAILRTVGGLLAVASLMPGSATKAWVQKSEFAYKLVKANDAARVFSDGTLKGIRDRNAIMQQAAAQAVQLGNVLRPLFKSKQSQEAMMFALDEGPIGPEWHTLSTQQQSEVAANATLNRTISSMLLAKNLIKDARADYIAYLFRDPETRALWQQQYEKYTALNPQVGKNFATIREAIKWAQLYNKELPELDPTKAQAAYVTRGARMLANYGMREGFQRTGALRDYDPVLVLTQGNVDLRDRLRVVRIPNLGGTKMAPDEVATALERMAHIPTTEGFWAAADHAKSLLMRSIMIWPWEHGINVLRGALAIDGTGSMYVKALKAVRDADPHILEAAKYAPLFQRPDFGPEGQTAFDKLLTKIGNNAPTLKNLGIWIDDKRASAERALWDRWVPALGYAAWAKEMRSWGLRTKGAFGVGSPEYEAAAHKAGQIAADAMGKMPDLMVNPEIAKALRLAFFSPNWTRGRINMTMRAMGETQKIATGEVSPREASYLGMKLRSVLVGVALTAAGSYLLTRRWPKFNPNTNKYYMLTDVKDKNGREIGVDLNGWWQDDIKLMNDPAAYMRDRMNPMLREAYGQVTGRDVFGRSITGMERVESLIQMTGPPGEIAGMTASAIGHAMRGENPVNAANIIRDLSGIAAVGNVSALPREYDAVFNKYAAKLLKDSGLPDDKDRVFELSQLMKRNKAQGGNGFGGEVKNWIGNQQRQYRKHDVTWLWQQGKKAVRNLAR